MWGLSAVLAVVLAIYVVVLIQLRAASQPVAYPAPSSFGAYREDEAPYLLRRSATN
jgi:hypothetical protein